MNGRLPYAFRKVGTFFPIGAAPDDINLRRPPKASAVFLKTNRSQNDDRSRPEKVIRRHQPKKVGLRHREHTENNKYKKRSKALSRFPGILQIGHPFLSRVEWRRYARLPHLFKAKYCPYHLSTFTHRTLSEEQFISLWWCVCACIRKFEIRGVGRTQQYQPSSLTLGIVEIQSSSMIRQI